VRKSTKGDFVLAKAAACGSDANAFAALEATDGDTSSLCIAAGSYVAGDFSVLQNWSSSCFDVHSGLAVISCPSDIKFEFTRQHTVALPYSIPCSYCAVDQEEYEDSCLYALHARLLVARLCGHPFRSILLEIILGGNGASLSNRALSKVARILEHHDMNCVVDEALTAARCGTGGSMLYTLSTTPLEFQKRTTHVTIAKWPGIGMVLVNEWYRRQQQQSGSDGAKSKRGQSTEISCDEATKRWAQVELNLLKIPERRNEVLKAIGLSQDEAWGAGLLMYGPKHRLDAAKGLKNRYLPLLSPNTKVDSIRFKRHEDYKKECVCACIRNGVKAWVDHYPLALEHGANFTSWLLCMELAKPNWKGAFFQLTDMLAALCNNNKGTQSADPADLKLALASAVKVGLLTTTQQGKKRCRGFRVGKICHMTIDS